MFDGSLFDGARFDGLSGPSIFSVAGSATIVLGSFCNAGQPGGSPPQFPLVAVRRRSPFVGAPYRRTFVVSHVSGSAEIILSAAATGLTLDPVFATATIVLTASAAQTSLLFVSASAEIILTGAAVGTTIDLVQASATIVLTASASETVIFDNFLLHTPLSVIFLSASASTLPAYAAAADATIVLTAHGNASGGLVTVQRQAFGFLVLRCRADVPGLASVTTEDYLGRFQQGQEVPLSIQCFVGLGTAGLPDAPPIVRMYRDGTLVDQVILPLQQGTQVTGRFGQDYRLGYLTGPGRYLAAYWYEVNDVAQSQYQVFEVVSGGDPAGPVIEAQTLRRPGADQVLAHVASGALLLGQGPYLDEGV